MRIRVVIACLSLAGTMVAQTAGSSPTSAETKRSPLASTEPLKIDSAKEADIRRLMDLVGAGSLGSQMIDEMQKNIKPLMTQALPPGDYREQLVQLFFEKFRSKINPQQLVDMAVPAYDRHFTHQEIRGLIEFYQTPLGQKAVSVLPRLMVELQETGRKWGEGIGRDSMQEVMSEHPELEKALEDAKKSSQP
ncbi:MAG TPA: DUF2059 domain-containing protein [Terriglobales bacterium]|nr:DUF2059 domain-containing protein [Terriglobales bacterium]